MRLQRITAKGSRILAPTILPLGAREGSAHAE